MKIRNGFVSNSSSSSFIVAVEPNAGPLTVKINVEHACRSITTVAELKERCFRYYDDNELSDNKNYLNAVKAIESGKVIKHFVASSEDGDIVSGLHGQRLDESDFVGKVKVILGGDY